MRLVRLLAPFLALVALAALARAQSVTWEVPEDGTANTAVLVFRECTPDGQPTLPTLPGVTFTLLGRSESMNIVNFQASRSVLLTYLVRGPQNAPVQIPSFTVKTDKGNLRVPAHTVAAPAAPLDSVASSRLVPERNSVWAGEVFGLNYELTAARRTNPQISPTFDWNAAPLVAEDWSKPEVTEAVANGERRVNVLFRTRAIAKAPNTLKLEAASHLLSIQTGTIGFGIISQPRMEQVAVTSDQPTIDVRPLPAPPAGFSGAVGQFKLVSKVVPEKAAVGEPVTWTLELSGTGNWPEIAGLPARDVSNDFQVVQPKARRTPQEGKLFDVTLSEDVVLVPSKAGTYALGPVSFTYFDPKAGTYRTITAPRTAVTITAPAGAPFSVKLQPSEAEGANPPTVPPVTRPPVEPAPPQAIPRDPLPGSAVARAPMSPSTLVVWISSPFVALLGLWLALATRRAKATDPMLPRREAHARLARTLAHLQAATDGDRASLLLAWQRDAAILWQLPHAAPPASALPDAAWSTLWSEADRALYGTRGALPTDWIARAQEALAAKRVPGFKPWRLFLPQNLMPFAALLAIIAVGGITWLQAAEADAVAAYRKGEFAVAEKAWRSAIEKTPTDWIARHNLSLALAQQERATEAAAQATAAFVQNPADPAVRWHFTQAIGKAGTAPAALAAFITPAPLHALARIMSPANWQVTLVVVAWAAAAALAALLVNAYGRRSRIIVVAALVALVLCVGSAASAATSILSYGTAARADAVVVARAATLRSIPTEADTTQKTSPLGAGTLARADRTFLGWTRLAFENGQTGWVRKEEIVPLWK